MITLILLCQSVTCSSNFSMIMFIYYLATLFIRRKSFAKNIFNTCCNDMLINEKSKTKSRRRKL